MSEEPKDTQPTPPVQGRNVSALASSDPAQPTVPLALIQHASAPIAWVVIALLSFALLGRALDAFKGRVSEIEVASFRLRLENSAKKVGVPLDQELKGLRMLTMDQLQLFLVIGGETGDEVVYNFQMPHPRARRNYEALATHGLIELLDAQNDEKTIYKTTKQGRLVHKLLMDQLYDALVLAQGAG